MDKTEIAWAAGIFEGEGSIVTPNRLLMGMTDEDVVRRFQKAVGVGSLHLERLEDKKDRWIWRVSNFEHFQAVVAMFWPWLGERRRARAIAMLTKDPSRFDGARATATCGSRARYNAGCRCGPCRKAASEWHKHHRRRKRAEAGLPVINWVEVSDDEVEGLNTVELMAKFGVSRSVAEGLRWKGRRRFKG